MPRKSTRKAKGTRAAAKPFAKKRSVNVVSQPRGKPLNITSDLYDQDIKRRIGQFAGPGEAHMSKKGAPGKQP